MTNLPTNPLASLIKRAATSLPAQTGATAEVSRRLSGNSGDVLVLADVSGSMQESAGSRRKIEILRDALADIPKSAKLIAFSSTAKEVEVLPDPAGGTALHLALQFAARYNPAVTLVISDGQPDDKAASLAAARSMTGIINVLYCGPDNDIEAIMFMRDLARQGLGTVTVKPFSIGAPAIASAVKRLALPAK